MIDAKWTQFKQGIKEYYNFLKFADCYRAQRGINVVMCFHGFRFSFEGRNYWQTSRRSFKNTLSSIRKKYEIVTLSKLIETSFYSNGKRDFHPRAAVTIDDGFLSTLKIADFMCDQRIVPTIFVCPRLIQTNSLPFPELVRIALLVTKVRKVSLPERERPFDIRTLKDRIYVTNLWVEHLKSLGPAELNAKVKSLIVELDLTSRKIKESRYYDPLLNWEEIRNMIPHVEIGSHSCTHFQLSSLEEPVARKEITDSKKMIEENLHVQCSFFAYPYGNKESFTAATESLVREAGYMAGFSLEKGYVTGKEPHYSLPRVNAGGGLAQIVKLG